MSSEPSVFDRLSACIDRIDDYLADFTEDELVYVRPRERYDACIVGVDPSAGRIIYSEQWLLQAVAYYEGLDADRAVDFFNVHLEPLTTPQKGLRTPIFLVRACGGPAVAPNEEGL